MLSKEGFILSPANLQLNAFVIRNSGIQSIRMSLDMTDIIIAFTANREITGHIQNNLSLKAEEGFVSSWKQKVINFHPKNLLCGISESINQRKKSS